MTNTKENPYLADLRSMVGKQAVVYDHSGIVVSGIIKSWNYNHCNIILKTRKDGQIILTLIKNPQRVIVK